MEVPLSTLIKMTKLYTVLLDNQTIGITELEKADAPMGVVFGQDKI
jgi:hypothetical protein